MRRQGDAHEFGGVGEPAQERLPHDVSRSEWREICMHVHMYVCVHVHIHLMHVQTGYICVCIYIHIYAAIYARI